MVLVALGDEVEPVRDGSQEFVRSIAGDGQPAAAARTGGRERGDDGGAARKDGGVEQASVALPVDRVDEKVEDGPVVPEAVAAER